MKMNNKSDVYHNFNQVTNAGVILINLVLFKWAGEGFSKNIALLNLSFTYYTLVAILMLPVGKPIIYRIFSLNFLFVLGTYATLLLPYQLFLFSKINLSESRFLRLKTFENQSNRAIIIATLCIAVFQFAYQNNSKKKPIKLVSVNVSSSRFLSLEKFIALALLILLLIYLKLDIKSLSETRYLSASSSSLISEGIYFILAFFSMINFCLLFVSKFYQNSVSLILKLGCLISFFWEFRVLLVGDRNTFFLILLLQFVGYIYFYKRISIFLLLVLLISSFYLYLAVENNRMSPTKSILGNILPQNAFKGISISSWETSLNITAISLRATLDLVPAKLDYSFGLFKLIGVLGIFPFSRGFVLPKNLEATDTSQLISQNVIGTRSLWQIGTSLIGDCYIDFGVLGVLGFGYLIGYYAKKIQTNFELDPTPLNISLFLFSSTIAIQYSRYTFDFPIRFIVWSILLFKFFDSSLFIKPIRNSKKLE